jgi:hypothetical protein
MKVVKMSISLDPEIDREVRELARESGQSLSAWITEAIKHQLRSEALRTFFEQYQREHGEFTEEEREAARTRLGLDE